jgi:hypothetical protein
MHARLESLGHPDPVQIICARNLPRLSRAFSSPFVEVEIAGVELDNSSFMTSTVPDNGLCPAWNEFVQFNIALPELACLRFVVQEKDMFGDSKTIAQATFFLGSHSSPLIRSGALP